MLTETSPKETPEKKKHTQKHTLRGGVKRVCLQKASNEEKTVLLVYEGSLFIFFVGAV